MKKIIICCSISAADKVLRIKKELEQKGFEVEIPWGVKRYVANNYTHANPKESVKNKIDNNLIKDYYEKMKDYDLVLVINEEKKGIEGYIGGNTFLEMGFAHVLDKLIYILNPLPNLSYRDELEAMKPVILNGDLNKIT